MDGFAGAARSAGYVAAGVGAAETRIHLLEQVFFAVARQVDWDELALTATRTAVEAAGYPAPPGGAVSLDRLAAHHRVDARELKRDVDRQLQQQVQRDYAMVQEFRTAMLRLCQAQLHSGQVVDAEHAAVLDWLRGDLRQISALKSALIFRRIGRHNARHLLYSLAHWLAVNGRAGLALVLDIRRLGVCPPAQPATSVTATTTPRPRSSTPTRCCASSSTTPTRWVTCIVMVVASHAFLSDAARGLDAYQALKLRIFDEVRDVHRDNPLSSLIRLGAA